MTEENKSLQILDKARIMLAECRTIQDTKKVMTLADAGMFWAKKLKMSEEAREHCQAIRNEAELKMGEMLIASKSQMAKGAAQHGVGRRGKQCGTETEPHSETTLSSMGIDKKESARAQKLVKIIEKDEEVRDAVMAGKITAGEAVQGCWVKVERRRKQIESRSTKRAELIGTYKDIDIRKGDFVKVLSKIDDGTIGLILTDPPYGKDSLHCWNALGEFAARKLAADGLLIAYSGHMYLPQVFVELSKSLKYWWTLSVFHQGSGALTPLGQPVRKVIPLWKPLVMFHNGEGYTEVFKDVIPSDKPDKTMHNWSQGLEEARYLIRTFCPKNALVVDPFAGSGTVGQAAKMEKHPFIGAEILA